MAHFKVEGIDQAEEDDRPFVTLTLSKRGAERLRGLLGSLCLNRIDEGLLGIYNDLRDLGVSFDPGVDQRSRDDQQRRYGAMR